MQVGDRSVLNWAGEAAKHHCSHAFPQSPQNFVGRTLELPVDPSLGLLQMTMTRWAASCTDQLYFGIFADPVPEISLGLRQFFPRNMIPVNGRR
ncbi:hypothetical protein K503DRAFT_29038 [Rhizopogon vinicolor AM-OR11-026]|uniref:Uncharacterized protein n=1 Tax=Rhizopogon vinicolor AM-OR11-026 TaxID=1314800 RepID=A0A1B7MHB7_9AGAM|nr:hypothetical protein K503DRAFT_29038 [Rhizopogon vinicolor AM-OR11-026]